MYVCMHACMYACYVRYACNVRDVCSVIMLCTLGMLCMLCMFLWAGITGLGDAPRPNRANPTVCSTRGLNGPPHVAIRLSETEAGATFATPSESSTVT